MTYQFRNITVLVVEPTQQMFELIKELLMTFGVGQVMSAPTADIGFDKFCEYEPDLVIVDWLTDPKNGLELTKKIRRNQRSPNRFVPIILMTGYTEKRRVTAARDAGITEFLAKPFTATSFYKRIELIIEKPRKFVKTTAFFGPDRRRKNDAKYSGPERRDHKNKE